MGEEKKDGRARSLADEIADALVAGLAGHNADPAADDARWLDMASKIKPAGGKPPAMPALDKRGAVAQKKG